MKIGCFALVEPFTPMEHQFKLIKNMGIEYADLTDSHDGASLGAEFGFAATISLDSHPQKIREMLGQTGLYIKKIPHRIQHIHWKDLGADMIPKRGKLYGCGMGSLPLGDGVIGIKEIVEALKNAHIDVATTLEIAGANNVRLSAERLRLWGNPA